jgi:hypothetical protein
MPGPLSEMIDGLPTLSIVHDDQFDAEMLAFMCEHGKVRIDHYGGNPDTLWAAIQTLIESAPCGCQPRVSNYLARLSWQIADTKTWYPSGDPALDTMTAAFLTTAEARACSCDMWVSDQTTFGSHVLRQQFVHEDGCRKRSGGPRMLNLTLSDVPE